MTEVDFGELDVLRLLTGDFPFIRAVTTFECFLGYEIFFIFMAASTAFWVFFI